MYLFTIQFFYISLKYQTQVEICCTITLIYVKFVSDNEKVSCFTTIF